jgi:hypothetical protein
MLWEVLLVFAGIGDVAQASPACAACTGDIACSYDSTKQCRVMAGDDMANTLMAGNVIVLFEAR